MQTLEGTLVVTIAGFDGDKVLLDGNHPLAGKELTFAVEVLDVRDATAEELEDAMSPHDGCGGSCGDSCSDACGQGCCE